MNNPLTPPIAKAIPFSYQHLGHNFVDNYAWLQDKTNPEVISYLEAENTFAKSVLQPTELLQENLYQEMRASLQEDDFSAPERYGEYFYYWRMQAGQQYKIFYRKHTALDAPEELLVDENQLAVGKSYCRVLIFEPSPDHQLLAYSVDTTGARVFDLYIKDLQSGLIVSGPIAQTAYSAAWASDNRTLFYTVFDDSHRAYKLFRHTVGSDPAADVLVYQEPDESFFLSISRTRSAGFLLLTLSSQTTSEVHYLPADQPTGEFRLIHPRQHWLEYYVEHHGDRFLIRTNDLAENFKLMEAPIADSSKKNWRELIPHRSDTLLENVAAFQDHLVLYERQGGLACIRLSGTDVISNVVYISFPDPVYTYRAAKNPEYTTNLLRFYYSSLVTPESTIDYDLQTGSWDVKKRQEIPSGYDQSLYTSERLFATAVDGVKVPISLVYRKGLRRDGYNPLLLEGYGSYGFSSEPDFETKRLCLLERGYVYALAHVRGGSELGRAWYENGRLMHKVNTFTDFIACAEHLIAQGYTSNDHLAIMGGSAGGLLVSAVTNMRPGLFKVTAAMVPFTNLITAMLDPKLPLTVIEYEQWGNPYDPQAFDYMLSYSPYDNIVATAYPHIYAKAGLNDLQVPYWDPAKWVAKLRSLKTDNHHLVIVTNMGAGHGGASGRYDQLREDAQVYAFIIDTLNPPVL